MPRGKSFSQFFMLWLSQPVSKLSYVDYEKSSDPEMLYSLAFDLRCAQKTKPYFVTLGTFFFRLTASQGF